MSAIANERTKLLANALDRASTACFTVGVAAPFAAWITNALVFAHLTVDWGFHSMIPGMRRVLLSTQVRQGALGGALKGMHAAALHAC